MTHNELEKAVANYLRRELSGGSDPVAMWAREIMGLVDAYVDDTRNEQRRYTRSSERRRSDGER